MQAFTEVLSFREVRLSILAQTFAFGGFAREQICIYACPWPRIQAAMMDEDTLTIAYLRNLLRTDPDNPELRLALVRQALARRDYDGARLALAPLLSGTAGRA